MDIRGQHERVHSYLDRSADSLLTNYRLPPTPWLPHVEASNDFLQAWKKVVQPPPWSIELEEFGVTDQAE